MVTKPPILALKEEDQIKERIRYNTEIIKLFVVSLIATGGGVLALILGDIDTGREVVFTAGGIIIAVLCIVMIYQLNQVIKKLINNGK